MVPILDELLDNFFDLVTDAFGNYVLQHLLDYGRPVDKSRIIECLIEGGVASYATNKFASNIVEKALKVEEHMCGGTSTQEKEGSPCGATSHDPLKIQELRLAAALLGKPYERTPPLLLLAQDKFASYIVLRMLRESPQPLKELAVSQLNRFRDKLTQTGMKHTRQILAALDSSIVARAG